MVSGEALELESETLRSDLTVTDAAGQQRKGMPGIPSLTSATACRIGKASTLSGEVCKMLELLSGHVLERWWCGGVACTPSPQEGEGCDLYP